MTSLTRRRNELCARHNYTVIVKHSQSPLANTTTLNTLHVAPPYSRPACRAAAAAVDQYLLPAPDLSSKPAGRRCCCRSTGQTGGRAPHRYIDRASHTMQAASITRTFTAVIITCRNHKQRRAAAKPAARHTDPTIAKKRAKWAQCRYGCSEWHHSQTPS